MDVQKLILDFELTGEITNDSVRLMQEDNQLRKSLCNYFKDKPNRAFSICLLKKFIELRKDDGFALWNEDLMLASYILSLDGNVEDALLIFEAKDADFDTYCGMDGELVAFSGLSQTIEFLQNQHSAEAERALDYIECYTDEEISEYFSKVESMWWLG